MRTSIKLTSAGRFQVVTAHPWGEVTSTTYSYLAAALKNARRALECGALVDVAPAIQWAHGPQVRAAGLSL